jgi:predicted ribosomally synthesized peptide with nif11-like leader
MDEKRYEQAMELIKDEEFSKELSKQENPEGVQKLFASKGVELSIEELKDIAHAIILMTQTDQELSDEDLEQVAGGSKIGNWFKKAWHKVDSFMDKAVNDAWNKIFYT